MYWRFWRRVRIGPLTTLNVGKRGMSISFGVRGIHLTLGRSGTRLTAGLPGTGLSATEYRPHNAGKHPPARDTNWASALVRRKLASQSQFGQDRAAPDQEP